MEIQYVLLAVLAGGVIALLYALSRARWINRQPAGAERLRRISGYIAQGAMTFLGREYRALIPFVLVAGGFLAVVNWSPLSFQGLSFTFGAVCSALAGFVGMRVATAANVRTTEAAQTGIRGALRVAFVGGSVMGMSVVGLGLVGVTAVILVTVSILGTGMPVLVNVVTPLLTGFALGGSSIALFMRVGGGIYTKAADIGADLVGKLEANIPEDDPRNPATIADNVGDNVGDVAGMGADLFESYVSALVGCMILGAAVAGPEVLKLRLAGLPLILGAIGILASIAGSFLVRVGRRGSAQAALNLGTFSAAILAAALAYPAIRLLIGTETAPGSPGPSQIYGTFLVGLAGGTLIGFLTEYFTGTGRRPVKAIVRASETGPATTIITGVGMGMLSSMPIVLVLAAALLGSYALAGLYGVGMTALGMLSTLGIQLAVDAYGPIADNAGGIAEMAELPPEVRRITDNLDAVGNTTAAIGKGFAVGSAALAAISLFSAFKEQSGGGIIDITNIHVLAGLFIGAGIPFLFSSLAMGAIGRAAFAMIQEVRRQFRERPGILAETEDPDYNRCIDISTRSALREMILPGLTALAAPLLVGFLGGIEMLIGLLAGVTSSGLILDVFMANSGGAWDNAKKTIESRATSGKGSEAHRAAVVGDTVGDPFKDTAGPSINILIKTMSVISLVIAPMLRQFWGGH
ncbi:MAG TPA: sodium-translocating pyrophosphatase [Spirochaetia bacterium]|nr:sodium-translocating pyrophosphatase [Spirochaetia bacterium]